MPNGKNSTKNQILSMSNDKTLTEGICFYIYIGIDFFCLSYFPLERKTKEIKNLANIKRILD